MEDDWMTYVNSLMNPEPTVIWNVIHEATNTSNIYLS